MTDEKINILFSEICKEIEEKGFYDLPKINEFKGLPKNLIDRRALIKKIGDELHLISKDSNRAHLTEKGKEVYNQGGWTEYKKNITSEHKNDRAKIKNDRLFSKARIIAFWPLFLFSLIGAIYASYDFINDQNYHKELIEIRNANKKMELDLIELRSLISNDKNKDSLNFAKSIIDTVVLEKIEYR